MKQNLESQIVFTSFTITPKCPSRLSMGVGTGSLTVITYEGV